MQGIFSYGKNNPDLALAAVFAALTTALAPWDMAAMTGGINHGLLLLLFCLMVIVAGLRESGVLSYLYTALLPKELTARSLARFFVFACFFAAMLVTNDVALIIFVPLSLGVLAQARLSATFVYVVTLETVAANMGSVLTPVGNPQNLYIYAYYGISPWDFVCLTAPVVGLSGLLLLLALRLLPEKAVSLPPKEETRLPRGKVAVLTALFLLALATVLRLLSAELLTLVVVPCIALLDRRLFRQVDYKLLLLFVLLFIGVGSLGRLPMMQGWPQQLLAGRELVVSLLLSQVLSNVPTTVMLAGYTEAYGPLLLGVNIGGLGTVVASMASIISLKAYSTTRHSSMRRYMLVFSEVNVIFLLLVLGAVYGWEWVAGLR